MGCMPCREHPEGVEFGLNVAEYLTSWDVKRLERPAMPLVEEIPNGLYYGRTIEIEAVSFKNPKEFAINLIGGKKPDHENVLLHFKPWYDRRIVVRNHKRNGSWMEEDIAVSNYFPFKNNRGFRLAIFIADNKILISVNYRHFCSFDIDTRMSLENGRFVHVRGDINVQSINFGNSDVYPALPPTRRWPRVILPDFASMEEKPTYKRIKAKIISPGTMVKLEGRVKLLPQQFYINLQIGSTVIPHPIIPLHINLRLCQPGPHEQQMIFNSWIDGSWGQEMKPSECPFAPGMYFTLKIIYLKEGFHVKVNDRFLIAFPIRLPLTSTIDTILVNGDVIITHVTVSNFSMKSVCS